MTAAAAAAGLVCGVESSNSTSIGASGGGCAMSRKLLQQRNVLCKCSAVQQYSSTTPNTQELQVGVHA
jgi:hypothetical protein